MVGHTPTALLLAALALSPQRPWRLEGQKGELLVWGDGQVHELVVRATVAPKATPALLRLFTQAVGGCATDTAFAGHLLVGEDAHRFGPSGPAIPLPHDSNHVDHAASATATCTKRGDAVAIALTGLKAGGRPVEPISFEAVPHAPPP